MIAIDVRSDLAAVTDKLIGDLRRQIPFATAKTLTTVAKIAENDVRNEMRDVFDRPTPWTLAGTFVKPATITSLSALVKLKDESGGGRIYAAKYLRAEISGGERALKRYERALRSVGALPNGMQTVPGQGAKLDAYGNVTAAQIIQILSYFRAFPDAGYKSNSTAATRAKLARGTRNKAGIAYFVGRPADGKLPLGIWKRTHLFGGTAITPILLFVDDARYEKRFDFEYVVRKAAERHLLPVFRLELAEALRTAR